MTADVLIKRREVEARTSLSKTTIWRLVTARQFPAPIRMGGGARWSATEVQQWITDRLNERTQEARTA